MSKKNSLIVVFCVSWLFSLGRTNHAVQSKFHKQLAAITSVASRPSGFDSLKHTELVSGIWSVRSELDGFLPTIVYDEFHPAGRLLIKAESVRPIAMQYVRMLDLKGLPGYTVVDSDIDKTVELDRNAESRKVIYTKAERFGKSVITVIYNAHRYSSVTMLIESIPFVSAP